MLKRSVLFFSLALSGCVGSYIVHGEADMDGFESLHTVPDRPPKRSQKFYQDHEQELISQHSSLTRSNEARRKNRGLEVTNPCRKGSPAS